VEPALTLSEYETALRFADAEQTAPADRAEMLMAVGASLQTRPKTPAQLDQAESLYQRALVLCPDEQPLLRARILARLGTCLQAKPAGGGTALRAAREHFEAALPLLQAYGVPEEVAETELNLGLVQQALAGDGAARLQDAIQCYHRALRTFTRERHPQEYALLHNNLAVAYLSMPPTEAQGRMREALAVQSFEAVLSVISLVDHPSEYAMIQNNLGNALQYAASGHPLDNLQRALNAYDEALKVRTARDTPLEYANTIANKANALRNLPDEPGALTGANLRAAAALYRDARDLFATHGQTGGAVTLTELLREIAVELGDASVAATEVGDAPIS